jgi:hypothetical protein
MRRRIGEWLISAGALALLLLALVVIDDRARTQVTQRAMTNPSAEMSNVVRTVRSQTRHLTGDARETVHSHPELVVFAIAAAVLVGFMLRT